MAAGERVAIEPPCLAVAVAGALPQLSNVSQERFAPSVSTVRSSLIVQPIMKDATPPWLTRPLALVHFPLGSQVIIRHGRRTARSKPPTPRPDAIAPSDSFRLQL